MKNITFDKALLLFFAYKFPRLFSNIVYLGSLLLVTTVLRFEFGFSEMTAVIISLSLWFIDLLIVIFDFLSEPLDGKKSKSKELK